VPWALDPSDEYTYVGAGGMRCIYRSGRKGKEFGEISGLVYVAAAADDDVCSLERYLTNYLAHFCANYLAHKAGDLGLGYLEELPKQISSAIVLSEPFILVLDEKHRAAKKRVVLFEDLKDDLLLIPRKDLFPTLYL
jgi:hypothetical protein